jgi:hypothetical protein
MIVAIVGTLEGFKEKLQRTIDHVKSGVSHLNEDQIEEAAAMVKALRGEFDEASDTALEHLGHKQEDSEQVISFGSQQVKASTVKSEFERLLNHIVDLERELSKTTEGRDKALQDLADATAKPGQPVPEPLKSVVDESGAEVVLLPSIWHQHNSAGKEVDVHVETPGVIVAEPAKE